MSRQREGGNGKYAIMTSALILSVFLFYGTRNDTTTVSISELAAIAESPEIPDSVTLFGEWVPIEYFDVYEGLERELLVTTYWHSQTMLLIKKAHRYFPTIDKILEENNIPLDFKYLAIAESGLSNVVSPARAVGYWQLLEGTAEDYGLEVNDEVDERYHLEKATEAACKYLQESFDKYNSWIMAAASYNVGRRGVNRQIERQKETEYFNLLFNEETARYVYRILAFKLVLEQPEVYNFLIPENERYKQISYKTEIVNTRIENWADWAQEKETNYKMLKYLNPWLRDNKLSNTKAKEYTIKVPKKKSRLK